MKKCSTIYIKVFLLQAMTLAVLALPSCKNTGNSGEGEVLVRVYDRYLYESDLAGLVPEGALARDSLTMVRTFIQNWVDKELIVRKAEENLPGELRNFDRKLQDYRNSLIIFEYEKMLVRQELDTMISPEVISGYYEDHKNNFLLKKDILLMDYIVLNPDSTGAGKIRQWFLSEEPALKDSLTLYCSRHAESFNLLNDVWIDQKEMADIVPVENYSFGDFAMNKRYLESRDTAYLYLASVRDYRPADSIAPLQFVENEIRNMILNRRKKELIKNMRKGVLEDAILNNQVEIY
jgi:hypothetical protein